MSTSKLLAIKVFIGILGSNTVVIVLQHEFYCCNLILINWFTYVEWHYECG